MKWELFELIWLWITFDMNRCERQRRSLNRFCLIRRLWGAKSSWRWRRTHYRKDENWSTSVGEQETATRSKGAETVFCCDAKKRDCFGGHSVSSTSSSSSSSSFFLLSLLFIFFVCIFISIFFDCLTKTDTSWSSVFECDQKKSQNKAKKKKQKNKKQVDFVVRSLTKSGLPFDF